MNVKKFLAMLLTVAMLGGALAACGGGETTSTPSGWAICPTTAACGA